MELNRKRISKEQKFNILTEHIENGTPISELARLHGIHPITIYQWKRQMSEKPKQDLNVEKLLQELNDLKKKNKQLTKALGEVTLDNQCLKDINEFLKKKEEEDLLENVGPLSKPPKRRTKK